MLTDAIFIAGVDAATQGAVAQYVPPPAGLLRGPVPGEGPLPHRAGHLLPPPVLAEGAQSQGGDVPQRTGGDPGCD